MKLKHIFSRVLSLLLALLLLAAPVLAVPGGGAARLALLEEIRDYIETYALYPPKDLSLDGITAARLEAADVLFELVVTAWLAEDPYGYFLTEEEYAAAFTRGETVYGIGIRADVTMPLGVYVEEFIRGGGASRSGMERGAQVVSVDGVDVTDAVFSEVRHLFLGERGTDVEIGYINPGSVQVFVETISRTPLTVDNIQSLVFDGTDIGYITIERFGSLWADFYALDDHYHNMLPAEGANSVIIDLRGNPGGELETVINLLNLIILEEGLLICRLVDANGAHDTLSSGWDLEELAEMGEAFWLPDNIVVLVDGYSASAAEIFAGTLQAYELAVVVGEPTTGKSHSQYHIPLSTGDMLIVTSDRLELHKIGTYEDTGVIPDHIVGFEAAAGADLVEYTLDATRALFRHSILTERILAVQERLALLGFYRAEPSGVFDDYTMWCLNRFQAAAELPQSSTYANAATLRALDEIVMKSEFYTEDTQLMFAIGLLTQ
jgi:carboxyl-terminal processing protease